MLDRVVWQATLAENFLCQLIRDNETTGWLTVVRKDNDKTVLAVSLPLNRESIYDTRLQDLRQWEDLCVDAVDRELESA